MPALKAEGLKPEITAPAAPRALRLANAADVGPASDVALLQQLIEAEFSDNLGPRPWPRAISIPVTVTIAAGLWWGIYAGAKALFQF
jgi:hypothetical protein